MQSPRPRCVIEEEACTPTVYAIVDTHREFENVIVDVSDQVHDVIGERERESANAVR